MKSFNEAIGENITVVRREAKISQEELAYLLNLTRGSMNNIEAGRQGLNAEYLLRISQLCNCTISDIMPDYNFTYPAIEPFKARKLSEKKDHLKAKLAAVEQAQNEILAQKTITGDLTEPLMEF